MITADQLFSGVIGAIIGIAATVTYIINYFKKSITQDEALAIYNKAKAALDEYNTAIADGALTTDEKLKIAEKTLSTLQTVIKALE